MSDVKFGNNWDKILQRDWNDMVFLVKEIADIKDRNIVEDTEKILTTAICDIVVRDVCIEKVISALNRDYESLGGIRLDRN